MQGEEEDESPAAGTGSAGRTEVRLVGGVGCHGLRSCSSDDETAEEEEIRATFCHLKLPVAQLGFQRRVRAIATVPGQKVRLRHGGTNEEVSCCIRGDQRGGNHFTTEST